MHNEEPFNENRSKTFDDFMMYNLQSSSGQSKNLEQRSQQAINFYIGLLTAIVGAGIVVMTAVDDESLKLLIVFIGLAIIGFYGILTYFWLLTFLTSIVNEGFLRTLLYKYFRDIDPDAYDKYGLHEMLDWHKRAYERERWLTPASSTTLFLIALFSSFLLGCAGYIGWMILTGNDNLSLSILVAILCLITMGMLWVLAKKGMEQNKVTAGKFFFAENDNE